MLALSSTMTLYRTFLTLLEGLFDFPLAYSFLSKGYRLLWRRIRHHKISLWRLIEHLRLDLWCFIRHHKGMKLSKKSIQNQQKILDSKVKDIILLRNIPKPRTGWLKALRTGLGISARQLGQRLGVTHQVVMRIEKGEIEGTATIDSIQKVAKAMDCTFIYAVVPAKHASLDALLEDKAMSLARKIVAEVSHSMAMEDQKVEKHYTDDHIKQLAKKLKEDLDPRIWGSDS